MSNSKKVDSFYASREWFKLRSKVKKRWKAAGAPCGYCGEPIDWNAKPIADHIKNRKDYPALALSEGNIQILHHACNTRKSKAESKPEIGLDGWPL